MSTLINTAHSAVFRDGQIVISLVRGAKIQFPVAENPRLARGTPEQLNNIELSPFGLHSPDLDEDLSLRGIAQGRRRTEPNQAVERMITRCRAGLLAQLSRLRAFIAPL
jgi:Protein of unknown function (DUF2442)